MGVEGTLDLNTEFEIGSPGPEAIYLSMTSTSCLSFPHVCVASPD